MPVFAMPEFPPDYTVVEEASAPDELDEKMVAMIAAEVSKEKGEWARKILNVDPTPGLVLKPGLWLRYPKDPPEKFRVEVVRVAPTICQVFTENCTDLVTILTKNLLRYRPTIPPSPEELVPTWLKPGAHFLDPLATNVYAHWVVRTVLGGMCTAVCIDDWGTFSCWLIDELVRCQVKYIPTAWEHLNEDLV